MSLNVFFRGFLLTTFALCSLNFALILVEPLQKVRGAATADDNILLGAWVELQF